MRDNQDMEAGGVKFDFGKIRMDLVPEDASMAIAAVLTYGARKYDAWNWAKGMSSSRLSAALRRHLAAYELGEENDPESGLPHLWHIGCCSMMMISGDLRDVMEDDRCKHPEAMNKILSKFENDMKDPKSAETAGKTYGVFTASREDPYNEQGYIVERLEMGVITEAEADAELVSKGFPPLMAPIKYPERFPEKRNAFISTPRTPTTPVQKESIKDFIENKKGS